MKTFLAALALVIATSFARAQQAAPEPPLVTTSGTAEIKVVPDLADLSFEVEVRNADLAAARKEQTARATKVLAALRAAGVEEKELQSADISISPNFTENQRERVETAKVRFFSVSQRISATLHDVKKVPDAIAAAVNAGATGVDGVNLRSTELRKHRDEARGKAIKAAKEKAVALAGELGAKVGKPFKITEGSAQWRGSNFTNNAQVMGNANDTREGGGEGSESFAPGTISIMATITVSFLLE